MSPAKTKAPEVVESQEPRPDAPPSGTLRPEMELDRIGERMLAVVKRHANAKEASVLMLADFCWAVGIECDLEMSPKD